MKTDTGCTIIPPSHSVAGAREWMPEAGGGSANSFVIVEGRGAGVTGSGDVWYDVGSADPIRVTAHIRVRLAFLSTSKVST